jgi:D-alanyl-D-alanine carboxypeptidase/D-alanyl-D-alanine-endopeptidase (penicillin-binding protein 4)
VQKKLFLRVIVLLLFSSIWLVALPQHINTLIQKSKISKKDLSIMVKKVGMRGSVLVSLNAQKTRTPASVVKAMTTYSALLKLGFNYRWPTKFYTTGRIKAGVLYGDLIIKGFGDPSLKDRHLKQIIASIRAEGIKGIHGNIVIDRSYFNVSNNNSAHFDENPYSAYNAMPDALMFNERVSTVCIEPKKKSAYRKHGDKSYKVVNNLQHVNKPCKGRYSWPRMKIKENASNSTITFSGQISKRCKPRNICKVLTKPYKSFYYALKAKMRKQNMKVSGTLKLRKTPSNARKLFTHYSDKLEYVIAKTAKKSNNLYARHLLLLLGAKVYGAPATLAKGQKAIKSILASHDALGAGVLRVDNGSGLSRTAKLNASQLALMYDNAYDRHGKRWMNTLSIAGKDGTIRRRFRNSVVSNRAWMKTGTLKNVKNIGGYVKDIHGNLYTVVVLVNSTRARYRGAKLQNEIIKWVVKGNAKNLRSQGTLSRRVKYLERKKEKIQPQRETLVKQKNTLKKENIKQSTQKYYIQIGSFKLKPSRKYLSKIERLGLPYKVIKTDIYTVVIGGYSKESTVRKVLKKVKVKLNRSAFIKSF